MGASQVKKYKSNAMQDRDLSWLQFNARCQEEAVNPDNPLLERAKFSAIVSSNLDEFCQVRLPSLMEKAEEDSDGKALGGLSNKKVLKLALAEMNRQMENQYNIFASLKNELTQDGVNFFPGFSLTEKFALREKELFTKEILPYLKVENLSSFTPRQKQLYLFVKTTRPRGKDKGKAYYVVAIPTSLPRLYDLSAARNKKKPICLEDIVRHHVRSLFPKEQVEAAACFRLLRCQNYPLVETTEDSIVPAVRIMLSKRLEGSVTRLEIEDSMSLEMCRLLSEKLHVPRDVVFTAPGPLDLNKLLMGLYGSVKLPALKFVPAKPAAVPELMGDNPFGAIDKKDYLLFHPYHSFDPVVHLLEKAAEDPTVTSIKITLYRVSGNSPIVAALIDAAENGKEVFVLFDAHARFDEENNLYWGERLSRAGCQVKYGVPNLKVHSKIAMIERNVDGKILRTLHLGTGNYHDGTAKLYTDFGLLTADVALGEDAAAYFRWLDDEQPPMKEIYKSPDTMQPRLLELIHREAVNAQLGLPAGIFAKMNALTDPKIAKALMEASCAGVHIRLMVRGACCILPGIKGYTEKIEVRSIVGRHLEHARAFAFQNGGLTEVYLSSADWMQRNLYKRFELMFPVKAPETRDAVLNVLDLQWNDTEKCRHRMSDGSYHVSPMHEAGVNAQEEMLKDVDGIFARGRVESRLQELAEQSVPQQEDDQRTVSSLPEIPADETEVREETMTDTETVTEQSTEPAEKTEQPETAGAEKTDLPSSDGETSKKTPAKRGRPRKKNSEETNSHHNNAEQE